MCVCVCVCVFSAARRHLSVFSTEIFCKIESECNAAKSASQTTKKV